MDSVHAQETTTYYFSPFYEVESGVVTKYYPLAGGSMAMRRDMELFSIHHMLLVFLNEAVNLLSKAAQIS